MKETNPVYGEVWSVLSKINVSEYTEEKMGLTFLSWSWAWKILMDHYPDSTFSFSPTEFLPDGSAMVECTVTIKGEDRSMWLPVMDNRMNASPNPSSREISDSKMRCLVKCLAVGWGLGFSLYLGLGPEGVTVKPSNARPYTKKSERFKKKSTPEKSTPEKTEKKAAPKKKVSATNGINGSEHPVVTAVRTLLVAGAETQDQLTSLWTQNVREYEALDKAVYTAVVEEFSKRKNQLKKEQKEHGSS